MGEQANKGLTRFQNSLGTQMKQRYKGGQNINQLMFARVLRVNYEYNTVDVATEDGSFISSPGGELAAKMPVTFAGKNSDGVPFGQIAPIEVGSLVLLGFVRGSKTSPVILNVYADNVEAKELSRSPLGGVDSLDRELDRETQQFYRLYPGMNFDNVDGGGNRTSTLTGKSYISTDSSGGVEVGGLNDYGYGTEYSQLEASYTTDGNLIEPRNPKAPTMLLRHEGGSVRLDGEYIAKEDDHVFMWYLDEDGTQRSSILREGEDWRAYIEMTPEGRISLVRQNDSKLVGKTQDKVEISLTNQGVEITVGDRTTIMTKDETIGDLTVPNTLIERLDQMEEKIRRLESYH